MVGSVPPSSRADAGGQLLRELEALSQALYKTRGSRRDQGDHPAPLLTWHSQGFEKGNLPDYLGVSKDDSSEQQVPRKKKGGSLWDWKPLRALAHIGQTKFDCEFVAHVHGINKLPVAFEGLRLQVRLKHKETEVRTVPSLVFKGCADFEEALRIKCAVYGSCSSSGGIKYMSKTFTLSVVAPDASELELGKHRLDLSRILPDGNGEATAKSSSWNTSFKLSDKAKGGVLMMTFGYELGKLFTSRRDEEEGKKDAGRSKYYYPQSPDVSRAGATLRSFNSLPSSPEAVLTARKKQQQQSDFLSEYSLDVIDHLNLDDDVVDDDNNSAEATTMTMSTSSGLLAPDTPGRQQEEELKGFSLEHSDDVHEDDDEEFSVIEQGVEESRKAVTVEESRNVHPEVEERFLLGSGDELEDEAEKFLHMLKSGSDSEDTDSANYSPRGLLLKQFELEQQNMLLKSVYGISQDAEDVFHVASEGNEDELSAFMDAAESELQKATQAMKSKARAKMLEDAEAEALMQEWGLNEKAFQSSPPKVADPVISNALILMPEPPCLADGLGSMIPTRDGGSLRSMNPIHFQGGRNDGRLVLQVSKPVVVPADMGSGVLDIFRSLAAGGAENMALQVMETMPLEDITGKNIYQIAMEGQASHEKTNRKYALGAGDTGGKLAIEYGGAGGELISSSSGGLYHHRQQRSSTPPKRGSMDDTFMSLEDLAPVAMEKIEALAMQGLKIQSDMSEEEAPYALDSFTDSRLRLEGSSGGSMHLLEADPGSSADGGLMAMSISLDEWMRLDAGIYDEDDTADKTKSILAAHQAAHHSSDIVLLANEDDGVRGRKPGSKSSSAGGGLMGDTLTLTMLVQLRDPVRNFEPVGAPMMAFVQAERVMVPPRPKMWKRVSVQGNSEQLYEEDEQQQQQQSQFKITGVHMAGLKPSESESGSKKRIWGTQKQQQSGSRWLLAHGMGKTGGPKHPLLKSKNTPPVSAPAPAASSSAPAPAPPPPAPSTSKNKLGGESLWSISAKMGSASKAVASKSSSGITRNPDVKFGSRLSLGKKKW